MGDENSRGLPKKQFSSLRTKPSGSLGFRPVNQLTKKNKTDDPSKSSDSRELWFGMRKLEKVRKPVTILPPNGYVKSKMAISIDQDDDVPDNQGFHGSILEHNSNPITLSFDDDDTNDNDSHNQTIAKAEFTRKRLDSLNDTNSIDNRPTSHLPDDLIPKTTYKDIDGKDITLNLRYTTITFRLKSLWTKSRILKAYKTRSFEFNISTDNTYIYFSHDSQPINGLVIDRDINFKKLYFAEDCFIIELRSGDYLIACHSGRDGELRDYIKTNKKWHSTPDYNISPQEVDRRKNYLKNLMKEFAQKNEPLESESDPLNFPSRITHSRATRAKTRDVNGISNPIKIGEPDLTMIPRQIPHKFTPDLKHKFNNNKFFTITYSDFKTLYNNDWINDSMIDFFIQYEIDLAIKNSDIFNYDEIYAFNSFFFTKLMSNSNLYDTPNYYENIKRWLSKLDLMQFPYIIMPINENLHWYCCIIRGLPDLLSYAKSNQSVLQVENTQDVEYIPEGSEKKTKIASPEIGDTSIDSNVKKCADIFVFDSLGHKHSNISNPLKSFIIDYCQDVHKVIIPKTSIRVLNVRVPKQSNFNDCGLHVIFNVRKWLQHTAELEKMWKGTHSKQTARVIFDANERSKMRKQLQEIMINLHKEQDDTETKRDASDAEDDIEVIEYPPADDKGESFKKNESSFNFNNESIETNEKCGAVAKLEPNSITPSIEEINSNKSVVEEPKINQSPIEEMEILIQDSKETIHRITSVEESKPATSPIEIKSTNDDMIDDATGNVKSSKLEVEHIVNNVEKPGTKGHKFNFISENDYDLEDLASSKDSIKLNEQEAAQPSDSILSLTDDEETERNGGTANEDSNCIQDSLQTQSSPRRMLILDSSDNIESDYSTLDPRAEKAALKPQLINYSLQQRFGLTPLKAHTIEHLNLIFDKKNFPLNQAEQQLVSVYIDQVNNSTVNVNRLTQKLKIDLQSLTPSQLNRLREQEFVITDTSIITNELDDVNDSVHAVSNLQIDNSQNSIEQSSPEFNFQSVSRVILDGEDLRNFSDSSSSRSSSTSPFPRVVGTKRRRVN